MNSLNARLNEAPPNKMSLDRHSCLIEQTQRSAIWLPLYPVVKQALEHLPRRAGRNCPYFSGTASETPSLLPKQQA
jgi:hypothetical protein